MEKNYKKEVDALNETFDNATSWRYIGDGIYMKDCRHPLKGDYAGEKITKYHGDRSFCMDEHEHNLYQQVTRVPEISVCRLYKKEDITIASILRYPHDVYCPNKYIWEIEQFFDDYCGYPRFDTEIEMEIFIRQQFKQREDLKLGKLIIK